MNFQIVFDGCSARIGIHASRHIREFSGRTLMRTFDAFLEILRIFFFFLANFSQWEEEGKGTRGYYIM